MWFPRLAATLTLVSPCLCQGLRIGDKVDRPVVYLAQRAPESEGGDVLSALGDPLLGQVLGWRPASRDSRGEPTGPGDRNAKEKEVDAGSAVPQRLRALLSRLSVSSELALVSLLPAAGRQRPLLVFHCQLSAQGRGEIGKLLQARGVAEHSREVHGKQVFRLLPGATQGPADVEFVLHDHDLLVSNDRDTMDAVLDPRTKAGGGVERDPAFVELRKRVDVPPGSLLCYIDLEASTGAFWRALPRGTGDMLRRAGVRQPRQLMLVARPDPARKTKGQAPGIATQAVLRHRGDALPRRPLPAAPLSPTPPGWLGMIEPKPLQQLLRSRPSGGLLSMSFEVDQEQLLTTRPSREGRWVQSHIFRMAMMAGLDLRNQVLRRLDDGASIQLVDLGDGASLQTAVSMQAKNAAAARAVFRDLQQALLPRGRAVLETGEIEFLRLRTRDRTSRWGVGRIEDRLVFARSVAVLAALRSERSARQQRRHEELLRTRLRRLGKDSRKVHGLFVLDLRALVSRLFGAQSNKTPAAAVDDTAGLFGIHVGLFSVEKNLLRLELASRLQDQAR